jgi:hypothetical protein
MLTIANLKPDDVARIYYLLRDQELLGHKDYANFVKQLRVTIDAQKKLNIAKQKPLNPYFTNIFYGGNKPLSPPDPGASA